MLSKFLSNYIESQAEYIKTNGFGYGQVEPNHLSAQRTGQIYAQLPAAPAINVLENGQFVKYDYMKGEVNFTGAGEWMLVFNEIKLYRDGQLDAEFAMLKDNYQARVYSPTAGDLVGADGKIVTRQARWYNGKDYLGNTYSEVTNYLYANLDAEGNGFVTFNDEDYVVTNKSTSIKVPTVGADGTVTVTDTNVTFNESGKSTAEVTYHKLYDDVTGPVDPWEVNYTEDPFHFEVGTGLKRMPAGTTMVPRVFKTNVGDIYTTNMLGDASYALGDIVAPREADGILAKGGQTNLMKWQVVKLYTMPDHQPGVKLMRIA